jgi:hypothetical protein
MTRKRLLTFISGHWKQAAEQCRRATRSSVGGINHVFRPHLACGHRRCNRHSRRVACAGRLTQSFHHGDAPVGRIGADKQPVTGAAHGFASGGAAHARPAG